MDTAPQEIEVGDQLKEKPPEEVTPQLNGQPQEPYDSFASVKPSKPLAILKFLLK